MYANIIVDISHESVDRIFQYRIPQRLEEKIHVGVQVRIPFGVGNRIRKGYVVELSEETSLAQEQIKEIQEIEEGAVTVESQLIGLARWMKEYYGSTMNQALKTVLPVRQKVRQRQMRWLVCPLAPKELDAAIEEAARKKYRARERLLRAFCQSPRIPWAIAEGQLNLSAAAVRAMEEKGIVRLETRQIVRGMDSLREQAVSHSGPVLNGEQQAIVRDFTERYDRGERGTSLIYGITGSGKTEVYMEIIAHVLQACRQVIVLVPEIALTYQTVLRFYRRFGDRVSVINSRLSAGERYDQLERARTGEAGVMIGPRSAVFTPFPRLGLIIMDEEHEGAYKSELSPRYHAREVAAERARLSGASLILGSATPSLESYSRALSGDYHLYRLRNRAKPGSSVARVTVADLREELKAGNRSVFSRPLREAMEEQLGLGHQIMLFLNRRGYSGFVSCRSCGKAVKCPHCDVALTLHRGERLVCHYCGYRAPAPVRCPSCGSPYIAGFGTGTQKIEELAAKAFPQARVLRMDLDTTSKKGGHQEILSAFARGEADILVGTQMIVKGHDFPNVTLVGILAADMSLNSSDFRCAERTFQLLTQAAGRAGRDGAKGEVIIQTYNPDHYSIVCAARQDYEAFYEQETAFRSLMRYPPASRLLSVMVSGADEKVLAQAMTDICRWAEEDSSATGVETIGPADAQIYKVNDIYRKILYMKQENYDILIKIRNRIEMRGGQARWSGRVMMQFDLA